MGIYLSICDEYLSLCIEHWASLACASLLFAVVKGDKRLELVTDIPSQLPPHTTRRSLVALQPSKEVAVGRRPES